MKFCVLCGALEAFLLPFYKNKCEKGLRNKKCEGEHFGVVGKAVACHASHIGSGSCLGCFISNPAPF